MTVLEQASHSIADVRADIMITADRYACMLPLIVPARILPLAMPLPLPLPKSASTFSHHVGASVVSNY